MQALKFLSRGKTTKKKKKSIMRAGKAASIHGSVYMTLPTAEATALSLSTK